MNNEYFDKVKQGMFPEIKDWTDPQDKYRFETNIKAMPWKYWFWMHPTAYTLIYYGYPLNSIAIFTLVTAYFVRIGVWIGAAICSIFVLLMFIRLGRKIRDKNQYKNMTFYDQFMREFKVDKVK